VNGLTYLRGDYKKFFQFYTDDGNVTTWVWELHEPSEQLNTGLLGPQGESGNIFPNPDKGYTPVLKPRFKKPTDPDATTQYYSQWQVEKASRYPDQYDRAFRSNSPLYFTSTGERYVYEHLCCGDKYVSTQANLLLSIHWINWFVPLLTTGLLSLIVLLTVSQHLRWKLVQKPSFERLLYAALPSLSQTISKDTLQMKSVHNYNSDLKDVFQTNPLRFNDVFHTTLLKLDDRKKYVPD
jgi:hypothetical protein